MLDKNLRMEIIIASVLTLFVVIVVPIYAWFAYINKMEAMTKIMAPASLDLKAGHADLIENFELKNIDIASIRSEGSKCYVFCVKTGSTSVHYDIQLAHTTNIPLTYTLYRANEVTAEDSYDVDYTPVNSDSPHTYYAKSGSALSMRVLNGDATNASHYGRMLAKDDDGYVSLTYDTTGTNPDAPEIYAIPIYSQVTNLETLNENYDFFILELSWAGNANDETGFQKWNKAENNEETDVIYISAARSTQ